MSRVQMVENNYGNLSSSYSYLAVRRAIYERAGYRELWPKHELAAKLFFGGK